MDEMDGSIESTTIYNWMFSPGLEIIEKSSKVIIPFFAVSVSDLISFTF
jgi:hypothetical protein